MGLRRAMTGTNFDQRVTEFKPLPVEEKNHQLNLTQSIGNDSLLPVPSLGGQSIPNDFKTEFQTREKQSGGSLNGSLSLQRKPKAKTMKECLTKISKLFNDNHSKIQKYSKKVESQNKFFSLNVSTKIQRKEESARIADYQFHVKEINNRKY